MPEKNATWKLLLYLSHGWGKTLTCSMLKELFEGNKELFRGLDIYTRYSFEPHPVIYLDFRRLNVSETLDTFMEYSSEKSNLF